jgi:hypothetical protein
MCCSLSALEDSSIAAGSFAVLLCVLFVARPGGYHHRIRAFSVNNLYYLCILPPFCCYSKRESEEEALARKAYRLPLLRPGNCYSLLDSSSLSSFCKIVCTSFIIWRVADDSIRTLIESISAATSAARSFCADSA